MSLLEVEHLSIMFGGLCAVDDFNLTLEKGEVDIEGTIDSMVYSSNEALRKSGESLFTRLFK